MWGPKQGGRVNPYSCRALLGEVRRREGIPKTIRGAEPSTGRALANCHHSPELCQLPRHGPGLAPHAGDQLLLIFHLLQDTGQFLLRTETPHWRCWRPWRMTWSRGGVEWRRVGRRAGVPGILWDARSPTGDAPSCHLTQACPAQNPL